MSRQTVAAEECAVRGAGHQVLEAYPSRDLHLGALPIGSRTAALATWSGTIARLDAPQLVRLARPNPMS